MISVANYQGFFMKRKRTISVAWRAFSVSQLSSSIENKRRRRRRIFNEIS